MNNEARNLINKVIVGVVALAVVMVVNVFTFVKGFGVPVRSWTWFIGLSLVSATISITTAYLLNNGDDS